MARLRDHLLPALACLLAGAAISIVVAEACALRGYLRDPTESVLIREKPTDPWTPNTSGWLAFGSPPHPDPGPAFARLDAISTPSWASSFADAVRTAPVKLIMVTHAPGLRDECLGYLVPGPEGAAMEMLLHRRAGWPFASLSASGWSSGALADPNAPLPMERWIHSVQAPAWTHARRTVPGQWRSNLPRRLLLEPLPLGLLADSLIYSLLVALPVLSLRALRRSRRLRRNHCPRCNYNRIGLPPSAPCPECGPVSTP